MASYPLVLPPPEGTYPYKPSFLQQLAPIFQGFSKGINDRIVREAVRKEAEKYGLQPEITIDDEGNKKTVYKKPSEASFTKSLMMVLGDMAPMENILSKEDIQKAAPFKSLGKIAEGGEILMPSDYAFKDGQIFDKSGNMVGEYDPSKPPTTHVESLKSALKEKILGNVFAREAFGIPKAAEASDAEKFRQQLQGAKEGKMTWDELIAAYPDKVDQIKKLQLAHTPIEKSSTFKEGFGLPAYFSKDIAKIDSKTKYVLEQIKTEADLKELVDRSDEAKKKGIDVDAILEYFGKK
jgi:hypothetical protein